MEINIDKITEKEVENIFNTPKLHEMFYKVKSYADLHISVYELTSYMSRLKFDFSVIKKGNGVVYINVTCSKDLKFVFKY